MRAGTGAAGARRVGAGTARRGPFRREQPQACGGVAQVLLGRATRRSCAVAKAVDTGAGVRVTLRHDGRDIDIAVERVIVAAGIVVSVNAHSGVLSATWAFSSSRPTACFST